MRRVTGSMIGPLDGHPALGRWGHRPWHREPVHFIALRLAGRRNAAVGRLNIRYSLMSRRIP